MDEHKLFCIYHGGCDDGFAAACVAHMRLGDDVEFYPGVYQREPPDVTGRHVLMVDFSYKRPIIEAMAKKAASVLILDHHHTAAQDLFGYRVPIWGAQDIQEGIWALFDMQRSGAGITWDFLFGGAPRPPFIDYIEDRDLWRKSLPNGDEFTMALRSYPQDFAVWERLIADGPEPLIAEGKSIHRYYRRRVDELKESAYLAELGGHRVWIANAPYFAASEVAGELAEKGTDFGACYFESRQGQYTYSLRSRNGFDCSEVAKQFGGGGHKAAAGFRAGTTVHVVVATVDS